MIDLTFNAPLLIFGLTIVLSLIGLFVAPQLVQRSLFRPYWLLRKQQYDTLIMSGFVHADVWHLLFNMVTFYFFAFGLARRIGDTRFVLLYVLALVLSEVGTYIKHRNNPDYASLGASGAISAVLFASVVYFPTQTLLIFPIPVPLPAPVFAVGYLAYTYWSARRATGRINHDAHLSGALFGLLFVVFTDPAAFGVFKDVVFG
jgi:membrane associated rhomboid family serine protease